MTFAHISDFHINGYHGRPFIKHMNFEPDLFCKLMNKAAVQTLEHIATEMPKLNILLITGDMFGNPLAGFDADAFLRAIDAVLANRTMLVFTTGSHDDRESELLGAIQSRCTAFFDDTKRYSIEDVGGVSVYGIGDCPEKEKRLLKRPEFEFPSSTNPRTMLLAHRSSDLPYRRRLGFTPSYTGFGHKHEASLKGPSFGAGSIPCFVLSRFIDQYRSEYSKPLSNTMTQVKQAGIIHGAISDGGSCELFFRPATCRLHGIALPDLSFDDDIALDIPRSSNRKTERAATWQYGTVNRENEHMLLYYGTVGDEPAPYEVAAVSPISEHNFVVELTGIVPDNIIKDIESELNFCLVEKGEKAPWTYMKHHCTTAANIYSSVHWVLGRPRKKDVKKGKVSNSIRQA